jgi:hypothetical protein
MAESSRGPFLSGGYPGQLLVKESIGSSRTIWTDLANLGLRERLTADRNYYVSPSGSDSNTGMPASSPFKTIQKAIDTVTTLDLGGKKVDINIADGTYNEALILPPLVGDRGKTGNIPFNLYDDSSVSLVGNVASPSNVNVQGPPELGAVSITCQGNGWHLTGLEVKAPVNSYVMCIVIDGPYELLLGQLNISNSGASTFAYGIVAQKTGVCINTGQEIRFFGTLWHEVLTCLEGGRMVIPGVMAVNNNPAIASAFCHAALGAGVTLTQVISGTATGKRYNVTHNAVIVTDGVATFFPGSIAGTATLGGLYAGP